jgi:hypothetical protein
MYWTGGCGLGRVGKALWHATAWLAAQPCPSHSSVPTIRPGREGGPHCSQKMRMKATLLLFAVLAVAMGPGERLGLGELGGGGQLCTGPPASARHGQSGSHQRLEAWSSCPNNTDVECWTPGI